RTRFTPAPEAARRYPPGRRATSRRPGLSWRQNADHRSAHPATAPDEGREDKGACTGSFTPEARRLYARVHHDAQEAHLGPAEGLPRSADERIRSHELHRW